MSNFCSDQGRTRVFGEAYSLYAAAGNPRRTQIRAKKAIYGWKLINGREPKHFLIAIRFLARPLPKMKKSAKNKEALNNHI
jgi:hypothetical protein